MWRIGIHSCVVNITPPIPLVSSTNASICSIASSGVPIIQRLFSMISSNVKSAGFWSGCTNHELGVLIV